MRLRIVDIDLFLDYKLRQNKGARGQPLPFVKYLGRFNTPKGAAMRNERNAMNWPIGLAAIAVFYDLLLYSTGCKARGVLADSDGGFTVEWLHGECKCPVDVLPEVIRLLIRYGWLADDDDEIQPSMQTGKVLTSGTSSAEPEAEAESPADVWHDVAVKLVHLWHAAGARQKTIVDPGNIKALLLDRCRDKIDMKELILANASDYLCETEVEWLKTISKWIIEGKATAPRRPAKAKHSIELTPEEIAASEEWEAQMRAEHAEGKISDEAMRAWGLL
ncbi:hypothetical protein UFOVP398_48 [uncultured Caudovirales phage]|uniref:Uncharacterized protein n=1 Tax=uncultured Caudovirales phage TaxID=2100421 RepID=A0A6J5M0V2_9CAUD|nr:hypothetical protein UFOVP398_48 [uncultured Caudovirales phage]